MTSCSGSCAANARYTRPWPPAGGKQNTACPAPSLNRRYGSDPSISPVTIRSTVLAIPCSVVTWNSRLTGMEMPNSAWRW